MPVRPAPPVDGPATSRRSAPRSGQVQSLQALERIAQGRARSRRAVLPDAQSLDQRRASRRVSQSQNGTSCRDIVEQLRIQVALGPRPRDEQQHVALLHPPVRLALADVVDDLDRRGKLESPQRSLGCSHDARRTARECAGATRGRSTKSCRRLSRKSCGDLWPGMLPMCAMRTGSVSAVPAKDVSPLVVREVLGLPAVRQEVRRAASSSGNFAS